MLVNALKLGADSLGSVVMPSDQWYTFSLMKQR